MRVDFRGGGGFDVGMLRQGRIDETKMRVTDRIGMNRLNEFCTE